MPPARNITFVAPEQWRRDWAAGSGLFAPLRWLAQHTDQPDWPNQADYHRLAALPPAQVVQPLSFVLPENLPQDGQYYETRIHRSGRVPTRHANWHDFFNAAVWLTFPLSKQALNRRHIAGMAASGPGGRGPLRDAATLFDESGIALPCCDPQLVDCLRQHRWQELFVTQRSAWGKTIDACVFGHAIYEKALAPYLGFTAKAWPIAVDAGFFTLDAAAQLRTLDRILAAELDQPQQLAHPRTLLPLPVLGVPGWWPDNEHPDFYANRDYFRPARATAQTW